jgi:hypothetical protein
MRLQSRETGGPLSQIPNSSGKCFSGLALSFPENDPEFHPFRPQDATPEPFVPC